MVGASPGGRRHRIGGDGGGAIDHRGTVGRGESIGKIDLLRFDHMIEKGLCPDGDPPGGRILGGARRMVGIRREDPEVL